MPLRLRRVAGLEGRLNDAAFVCATSPAAPAPPALVFFGGDVQDWPEAMAAHRDFRRLLRWNLEATATMLARAFPRKHIVVVRPSRIELSSISCYDNFVASNEVGVPEHAPAHGALLHLERLLQGVSSRVREASPADLLRATAGDLDHQPESTEGASASDAAVSATSECSPAPPWLSLESSRLTLAGFSKGCVVLNQIVHEIHHAHATRDLHAMRFISRISSLVWLDGGHAGSRHTWLTQRAPLATLAGLDLNIDIHVSPYQVQDESRPWIGREEKVFTSTLRKLGARVMRTLHGAGAPQSLATHFAVLDAFAGAHADRHTDTLADEHDHTHADTLADEHDHTHADTLADEHDHTHADTLADEHDHTHADTLADEHDHTHADTHTDTLANIHTDTLADEHDHTR